MLQVLLSDRIPSVLASALSAWLHVCPERTELLHRPYRQICRLLVEMDEWGQLVAMRVLSIYVRRCFNKPEEPVQQQTSQFYDDTSSSSDTTLDPDLLLLYKCTLQLSHSRSSAVCPWSYFLISRSLLLLRVCFTISHLHHIFRVYYQV